MLSFTCDYQEGALPSIINALVDTNLIQTPGYGTDSYCEAAKEAILKVCGCPDGEVHFLVGGTQTNSAVIDGLLRSYQGVIAAETGHVSCHEAGAIESCGHKVLTLPGENGKIKASQIKALWDTFTGDESRDHMVMPGMVYISQPTEKGTLYTLSELTAISEVCHLIGLPLYVDGARLSYALGSPENDVTLKDLARLTDIFYIGGTKCGALFGEAVVIPKAGLIPHFFTIIKQHGALLAKGRLLGIQFLELFRDELYLTVGRQADAYARCIEELLVKKGLELAVRTPTNQVFVIMPNDMMVELRQKVNFEFWEKYDEDHTVVRFATSWATTKEQISELASLFA